MNSRYTLTLIASLVAGGVAGFLLAKKTYKDKYAQIAEEDSESVREYYRQRKVAVVSSSSTLLADMERNGATDEELDLLANLVEKYQPAEPSGEEETAIHYQDMINTVGYASLKGNRNEQAKRNYNLYNARNVTAYEPAVNPLEDEDENDGRSSEIYVIEEPSFSEDFLHHDKISLVYYAEDDTLCEENEEIIPSYTDVIGHDTLDMRNATATSPRTIYVRNERIGADYEISICLDSYQRMILGIDPYAGLSPREAQQRRMRDKG